MKTEIKIYLAGFDVFKRDAKGIGAYLKSICFKHGFVGMFPFDNEIDLQADPRETARLINQANLKMINDSNIVLANLNNFRGYEPDSGTSFEVGYAVALGKTVWAYYEDTAPLRQQVPCDADGYDADDLFVEDFGLTRNLMLSCNWSGCSRTVEEAIAELGKRFAPSQQLEPSI